MNRNPKNSAASIEVNSRVKLIAAMKSHMTRMSKEIAEEAISAINSKRPMDKALAVNEDFDTNEILLCPEHSSDPWVAMLALMDKQIRATERVLLRAERVAKSED